MTDEQYLGPSRCSILETVAALGDIEFQRATWLDPEMQNPHFTYVEFVECFYDTCGGDWRIQDRDGDAAPFAYLFRAGVITREERDLFWEVHLALTEDKQFDDYDHEAILVSPSWLKVVETAARAVDALRATLKDGGELAALENTLPTAQQKIWP